MACFLDLGAVEKRDRRRIWRWFGCEKEEAAEWADSTEQRREREREKERRRR
jgi:hypothetical protein